uniref:C-type lectin domain family 4 member M-like n=1 Tax=Seriola dumerili TaxID=41447 RepID=A0A3B4V4K5_SERDU
METIIYENESAMSMVFENLHDATVRVVVSKSRSGEDRVKLYGLVAVSFGLLCILQVTLNIFLHLALCCTILQYTLQACIYRWLYFSGSLYYISSNEKTWQESRKDCLQKDADLIIINNKEEQNFMREFKKYLWIGLTDIETEGKWKWVDGTPLTRSFWGSKEPNGKTLENCGQIKHPDSENNWNDERCSNPHYWICEEKFSP